MNRTTIEYSPFESGIVILVYSLNVQGGTGGLLDIYAEIDRLALTLDKRFLSLRFLTNKES